MRPKLNSIQVRHAFIFLAFGMISISSIAQGVSFSYLIPKNGYVTAPISPFSIRGIGIGKTIGIETGATLYNIPGLGVEDLPFDYKKPLVGPHFAILVPADLYVKIPIKDLSLKFMVGGFGWWNINPRINEGNMDRAWKSYEDWEVLNTDFDLKSKLGYGWLGGMEIQFPFNRDVMLTFETNYLSGGSKTSLKGSYTGVQDANSSLETKQVDINNARTTLEGLEISFGAIFLMR